MQRLAWAHVSKDPRIAAGQQSPLEKQILNLGGVHTTAARQLITQKCQEEHETLCKEQAVSLDYWLARAESYYNERMMEMMTAEKGMELKTEVKNRGTKERIEEPKQYCWLPKRDRKQIERHIHGTGQAKEFKNKICRQPQPPSETTLPKIVPEKPCVPKSQRRKQVNEREQRQIKDHQERMTRGREIIEEKLKDRILRKSQEQLPTPEKCKRVKKDIKEFERVIVYPLYQPSNRSLIKVNILMEKSENREEVNIDLKSCERKFLAVPPFLRSQIRQIKN
ncbi:putative uncharacterized protein ZNRD1-AS1 [Dipodomys spectabilis]|uniref:putative uncharacterized protein ZNRD1-AS1 n=1 Tax=Dipodomys spectabilis TaxID=105255 RepID=UPI001C5472DB|nr:putative uncharacterized protein ZNRD1-AS1 [Dipodomys spectabilis]